MYRRTLRIVFTICAMAIIILDTKTVTVGANEGIILCIQTIIPALFPFIILSNILNSALLGGKINILNPFCRFCKIPDGAESLLLLGFLGGYPVGAQAIMQAYQAGSISKDTAKRMLGFCNNAGPAFLFGMISFIFSDSTVPWILWSIHILSALVVGFILPVKKENSCKIKKTRPLSITEALKNAIKTISLICGWVIMFRILICICNKWLLWRFPQHINVLISGLLELSNGCISLTKIPQDEIKFIYASIMLAFGGLCVSVQTGSVTQNLGFGYYFPGKLLQIMFSLLFSLCLQPFIFGNSLNISAIVILSLSIVISIYFLYQKKLWHLSEKCSIINAKIDRKEQLYAVSKKNSQILQLLPTRNRLL